MIRARSVDRRHGLKLSHVPSAAERLDQLDAGREVLALKGDDGLLRASDVALLKMNADFVVFSACNTAAGEKAGAEALSGLARAFFYAGARSLLVSNWEVDSESQ